MIDYWTHLKPRERYLLASAGIVLVLLMLYLFLLEPFMLKAESLKQSVATHQKDMLWLKQAALEVEQLRKGNSGNAASGLQGRSLLLVVDQSAKRYKLADSMKRVEPDGSTRVRVWLDSATFDEVTRWMSELESKYQLKVESAVIDKTDVAGRVNARLVFLGSDS